MSVYRVRISDEIYGILRAEALASGASLERLVEGFVLDGIARRHPARDRTGVPDDGVPPGAGLRRLAAAAFRRAEPAMNRRIAAVPALSGRGSESAPERP